ncbi:hypothetical protein OC842_007829 [Tilletia horrida]|uniref:Phospholipase/carboxylesterase/thioesterase domain-containing protein n=1 Tax=Tilletia horrida TaxID=155126 RepID=A0AAN6G5F0_9BASI|nr:hypothetical protein OC842_007829 [Tilletia horrida]
MSSEHPLTLTSPAASSSSSAYTPTPPSPQHPSLQPFHPHFYLPSPQKITSNLLILLPGLGDTPASYTALAQSFQSTLPQTAILLLRPPAPIPLLAALEEGEEEDASTAPHAWWDAFDLLTGDVLPPHAQNPGRCIAQLGALLDYLTSSSSSSSSSSSGGGCGWPREAVHLFGYGQGGSAALEGALTWIRTKRAQGPRSASSSSEPARELGSVVSVCGPMLSSPGGRASPRPASLPVLLFLRHPYADASSPQALSERTKLRAAFAFGPTSSHEPAVQKQQQQQQQPRQEGQVHVLRGNEDAMLRGKPEFDVLMRFWAQSAGWRNRSSWEVQDEGVYRVVG